MCLTGRGKEFLLQPWMDSGANAAQHCQGYPWRVTSPQCPWHLAQLELEMLDEAKPGTGDQSMPADPGECLGNLALGLRNLRHKHRGFRASFAVSASIFPSHGQWS